MTKAQISSVLSIYGVSAADALGRRSVEIVPELRYLNGTSRETMIEQMVREGVWRGEIAFRHPDGEERFVAGATRQIRDQRGNLVGLVATGHDITDHKRLDVYLERSQAQLAGIIDSAMDAIITVDEQQRITVWNAAAEQVFGLPADEAIGQLLDRFISARYREVHRRHIHAFGQTGVTTRGMGGLRPLSALRADGAEFPIEASISQVLIDGSKLYTVILRDITERVRSEAAQHKSEERLRAILDYAPAAIYVKDLAGRFLFVNRQFEALVGRNRSEIVGLTDDDFFPAEMTARYRENDREVLASGQPQELEEVVPHSDGPHTYTSIKFPLVDLSGAPYALCGISLDISERKRLEERLRQSQKVESIGQLAGGIAHDFNNLLTAIGGYADLALQEVPPQQPAHADLYEILKATERATSLTRKLLTFARRQPIDARVINLNDLILDMDNLLRRLIGEDINLVIAPTSDAGLVKADPIQLEQVLVNLAVNARRHARRRHADARNGQRHARPALCPRPHGCAGGRLRAAGGERHRARHAPEIQAHLFVPFFTTKGPGKGTGLGLSTCYGIVKQHGGTIWIYSEPGQGTVAKVYLPRVSTDAQTMPAGSAEADELPCGDETVLVVEDEPAVRALAVRVLRSCGYTVLEAENGAQACEMAEAHIPAALDLLLTDVVMPEMNGKLAAAQIAALYPSIKVLFMSGYTGHTTLQRGNLTADDALLQKPFTPAALAIRVREILDR